MRDMWAGNNYRITGDVEAKAPLSQEQLQRLLFMGPVRDLQLGQRPPYRFSCNVTPNRSSRLRVPFRFTDPTVGATIVIRDIQQIPSPEVVVGWR